MSKLNENKELSLSDKINEAQKLKDLGNSLFIAGDYRGALGKYVKVFF